MLRWIGFLLVAIFLANVLGHVPLVGGFFRRTGIFGVWLTALGIAWAVSAFGRQALGRAKFQHQVRALGAVETPHNQGKLGALHLAAGRARRALPLLEAAAAGEPESLEWRYRLGLAQWETGDADAARRSLESVVQEDPEYAYGSAQLRLAEAASAAGEPGLALAALETFERNHGPSPESAYRRGRALATLGEAERARRAFDEVGTLAKHAARYQRTSTLRWVAAAWFRRLAV